MNTFKENSKTIFRLGILSAIVYFIFANLGFVLLIFGSLFASVYYTLLGFFKIPKYNQFKMYKQNNSRKYNFNQNFKNNYKTTTSSFDEITKAKEFFSLKSNPNKEQIKKRYKELAKIYHPDINKNNENLMKDLNHYKEILLKHYS